MRKGGLSLKKIGALLDPPVTAERIRQILRKQPRKYRCEIHSHSYERRCRYCALKKIYSSRIDSLLSKRLKAELKRLSKKERSKDLLIQRAIFVQKLKDRLGWSFRRIGRELSKDHTTIIYLYNKKI